ncbi:hypothetical protein SISNIDRAFT_64199 [Sistotremastrum niveocremeum HHB9708]|uniref:Uncharacterized protein n=1 Tax=Sistotremastrum niveocremeum HHB9708 TaxID=1314777 RepID=A0A164UWH6_9AGAM|nr:hypothetical protein SISNIDRAFT_64199 [Sistotremastrum niveocremeum HHB9708]
MSHIHFGDADKKQGPQLPLNGTGKNKNSRSLASPGQYSNTNGGTPPRKKFKKDHARSSHNAQPNGVGPHKKAVNGVLKHKSSRSFNQEQDGAWTPIQKQRRELPIWAGKRHV